ncbi:MAG: hypothetical protein K0R57_1875 [Paenibacillaceae bacterium]|nr:hypothetical protein [Paenibacillaceae bacterium]
MNASVKLELSEMVRPAPRVFVSQTCKETLNVLLSNPDAKCIVVTDKQEKPLGLVMCDRFFFRLTGPYGIDMLFRESIIKLMSRTPLIATTGASSESLLDQIGQRPAAIRNDSIVWMEQGKFAGVIHVSDLVQMP